MRHGRRRTLGARVVRRRRRSVVASAGDFCSRALTALTNAQLDFLLKQQADQYTSLFTSNIEAAQVIEDAEAQQLWSTAFGRRVRSLRLFLCRR